MEYRKINDNWRQYITEHKGFCMPIRPYGVRMRLDHSEEGGSTSGFADGLPVAGLNAERSMKVMQLKRRIGTPLVRPFYLKTSAPGNAAARFSQQSGAGRPRGRCEPAHC